LPSFVGQTLGDAQAEVSRLDLTSSVVAHTISDRYPRGVIVAQRPTAQTPVRQGRQVVRGERRLVARQMPDFRYEAMREVNLGLSRERLTLGKVTYVNRVDIRPPRRDKIRRRSPTSAKRRREPGSQPRRRADRARPNFVGTTLTPPAPRVCGRRSFRADRLDAAGSGRGTRNRRAAKHRAGTVIEPFEPVSIQ